MDDGIRTLIKVATVFASLSLVSVGGGNTVLPEIHRAAVHDEQWMSDQNWSPRGPEPKRSMGWNSLSQLSPS